MTICEEKNIICFGLHAKFKNPRKAPPGKSKGVRNKKIDATMFCQHFPKSEHAYYVDKNTKCLLQFVFILQTCIQYLQV